MNEETDSCYKIKTHLIKTPEIIERLICARYYVMHIKCIDKQVDTNS